MSGFFGTVRTDGVAVEQRFLDRVMERLRFRGPDGGQTWARNGLGTCFAYLVTGSQRQSCSQPVRLGERFTLLGEVRLDERKKLIAEASLRTVPRWPAWPLAHRRLPFQPSPPPILCSKKSTNCTTMARDHTS